MTRIYLKNDPAPEAATSEGGEPLVTTTPMAARRFPLGRTFITTNAQRHLDAQEVLAALARHAAGDWGTVGEEDWEENELSLRQGFRLLSAYLSARGEKFWIITEADRSATTVLLPEDY